MSHEDIDRLLERNLGGASPGQMFRPRVLMDSTAAFVLARRRRARWRSIALSAAAVFIAAVCFLLGRCSMPRPTTQPVMANAGDTIAVPRDLIACLSAARLFKQLGMEDRMNRALDCAGRLLPREAITAGSATESVFAGGGEAIESQGGCMSRSHKPGHRQPAESANRILAESLGGYYHASAAD